MVSLGNVFVLCNLCVKLLMKDGLGESSLNNKIYRTRKEKGIGKRIFYFHFTYSCETLCEDMIRIYPQLTYCTQCERLDKVSHTIRTGIEPEFSDILAAILPIKLSDYRLNRMIVSQCYPNQFSRS